MEHSIQSASPSLEGTNSLSATPDLSGKTLGDFHLLRRLGKGGMGHVYLADQISLKRKVAIKVMRRDGDISTVTLQRFRAEAEAVARLNHTNVVQVYAIGEETGWHYMALEYVEGRNLRHYLEKKGPPEIPLVLLIMRQVAAALQCAGELGIIHRDIKPENILLTRRGQVKVTDFGLSRYFSTDRSESAITAARKPAALPVPLTDSGIALGTPLYMSPEQVQGETLDPRTDMYSFGVTCYHMLAGHPPFRGNNPFEVALKHVHAPPAPLSGVRPDLPADLCAMIHKMMAKERGQRYQTFHELIKDLVRLREKLTGHKWQVKDTASALPSSPEPATAPRLVGRWRRHWLSAIVGLSLVLAFLGGAGLAYWRDSAPADSVAAPDPRLVAQQWQEEFLRQQEVAARKKNGGPAQWLRPSLQRGLYYLEHNRLDEAEKFFTDLNQNVPAGREKAFHTLARLGRAIILSRNNQAVRSNDLFLEVLDRKHHVANLPFLFSHPRLCYQIERALDANKGNALEIHRHRMQLGGFLAALPPLGPIESAAFLAVEPGDLFPAALESYRNTTKNFGFRLVEERKGTANQRLAKERPKGKANP
jgi:serine/threonine-protein kinase